MLHYEKTPVYFIDIPNCYFKAVKFELPRWSKAAVAWLEICFLRKWRDRRHGRL